MTTNPEPESECVRVKREAQEKIARATEGMTSRQRDAYINEQAEEFAKELGIDRVSRPIGRGPEIGSERDRRAG